MCKKSSVSVLMRLYDKKYTNQSVEIMSSLKLINQGNTAYVIYDEENIDGSEFKEIKDANKSREF